MYYVHVNYSCPISYFKRHRLEWKTKLQVGAETHTKIYESSLWSGIMTGKVSVATGLRSFFE